MKYQTQVEMLTYELAYKQTNSDTSCNCDHPHGQREAARILFRRAMVSLRDAAPLGNTRL